MRGSLKWEMGRRVNKKAEKRKRSQYLHEKTLHHTLYKELEGTSESILISPQRKLRPGVVRNLPSMRICGFERLKEDELKTKKASKM